MTVQTTITASLAIGGTLAATVAVVNERRMQRHRLPGVGYADVTLRRDGAWRRNDLFSAEGLAYQRLAAKYGFYAVVLWVLSLAAWIVFAGR